MGWLWRKKLAQKDRCYGTYLACIVEGRTPGKQLWKELLPQEKPGIVRTNQRRGKKMNVKCTVGLSTAKRKRKRWDGLTLWMASLFDAQDCGVGGKIEWKRPIQ